MTEYPNEESRFIEALDALIASGHASAEARQRAEQAITDAAGAVWDACVNRDLPLDGGQRCNALARAALAAAAKTIRQWHAADLQDAGSTT